MAGKRDFFLLQNVKTSSQAFYSVGTRHKTDHSLPSSAAVKNFSYTYSSYVPSWYAQAQLHLSVTIF